MATAIEPETRVKTARGADLVCIGLERAGVDIIFGYPGGASLPIYDALPDHPTLKHVLVRHEQGATHMADGYARATGRAGVVMVTSGPGATNLVTGLACALIHDPAVLILDEPINGLDPRASRDVQERLLAAAARGVTIFVSTHLLDMAEKLCDRVGIIHHGLLVATGTLDQLRADAYASGSLEDVFLKITAEAETVAQVAP